MNRRRLKKAIQKGYQFVGYTGNGLTELDPPLKKFKKITKKEMSVILPIISTARLARRYCWLVDNLYILGECYCSVDETCLVHSNKMDTKEGQEELIAIEKKVVLARFKNSAK